MTDGADFETSQSLHYTVKAFLFSAPLNVEVVKTAQGDLKRVSLLASFRFPPPFGPVRDYKLTWIYNPDDVEIAEVWSGRESKFVRVARAREKLDLAQIFWGSGAKPSSVNCGPVLWRKDDIICREFENKGESFLFALERNAQSFVKAEGQWDSAGLLNRLRLSSLPMKLGAVTVERTNQ